jgi:hypothetical protein
MDPTAAPPPPTPSAAEPQLRYERLGGDLKAILASGDEARAERKDGVKTRVTALSLSSKLLALGTSDGAVAIMDYSGNLVRERRGEVCPSEAAHAIRGVAERDR